MVLLDWQKGKIPFFTLPPGHTEEKPPPEVPVAPVEDGLDAATRRLGEELPTPAEAVTEEDAINEAGASAAEAAAGV